MDVEVRRSRRRKRTISARREGDKIVVLMPAHLSRTQADAAVEELVAKVRAKEQRRQRTDDDLARRAAVLNQRFFGGRATPDSIRWVTNQNARWGSCTPSTRTIRISHRVQQMPPWVSDYVLIHELAHLLVAGHGPDFWAWVDAFPDTERAKAYLLGWAEGARLEGAEGGDASDVD